MLEKRTRTVAWARGVVYMDKLPGSGASGQDAISRTLSIFNKVDLMVARNIQKTIQSNYLQQGRNGIPRK